MGSRLIDGLATTDGLAETFSDGSWLQAMLDVEVALARAEAAVGVIPAGAADAIAGAARADDFDAIELARDAREQATVAIPFVKALRARVAAIDPPGATFVHWGATSQDILDTAMVLCLRQARMLLARDRTRLIDALADLSDAHARTVMLGRTLLQPAPPVTFGLVAAGWLAAVRRSGRWLDAAFDEALVLQFGGATGTLAALGPHGLEVQRALGRELALRVPEAPWHAHRDRLGMVVAACGVLVGSLGKIARDVSLLMQHEVGEAAEPGGGSSTMPHKRNPSGCAVALAAATRVPGLVAAFLAGMTQEHGRGVGGWHAEAPTVSATIQTTGAALAAMAQVAAGLQVRPDRMRANLAATHGVVFAERLTMLLAPAVGREQAAHLAAAAVSSCEASGRSLSTVVAAMPDVTRVLTPAQVADLDTPESYLGAAETFRQRLTNAGEPGSDR
jgi:3-carboxy-cis,cis-muconate cycloisomerase